MERFVPLEKAEIDKKPIQEIKFTDAGAVIISANNGVKNGKVKVQMCGGDRITQVTPGFSGFINVFVEKEGTYGSMSPKRGTLKLNLFFESPEEARLVRDKIFVLISFLRSQNPDNGYSFLRPCI